MIAEDEPPRVTDIDGSGDKNITLAYYTCCPPTNTTSEATDVVVTRHCSDPIIVPNNFNANNDTVCDDQDTRKYPLPMKSNVNAITPGYWPLDQTDSFLCCDNNNNTTTTPNFLDDSECVPYRNKFYETFKAYNAIGLLRPISCDFPEEGFRFSRPFDGETINDVASTGRYRCCKNGPALPPFIQDSAFKITLYPALVMMCVAGLVSAIVAIALLVPLLIQLKDGNFHRDSRTSRRNEVPRYSIYNLYLVYLAVFDLGYTIYMSGYWWSYMDQRFHLDYYGPTLRVSDIFYGFLIWEQGFTGPYMYANMFLNAIISYQVLALLRSSQEVRRIDPPTLKMVNLQAAIGIFISVVGGLGVYYIVEFLLRAIESGNLERVKILDLVFWAILVVMFSPPLVYVAYVSILIWWRGYIPSKNGTLRDKAMRELALYFYRIIGVFYGFWVPVLLINTYASFSGRDWLSVLVTFLGSLQPLATTSVILTKSDTRKYILDLVTLSYFSGNCTLGTTKNCQSKKTKRTKPSGMSAPDASANANVAASADANADANNL